MFWQDDDPKTHPGHVSDDVVDVAYAIDCAVLPVDHAWALSAELQKFFPWLRDEESAGLHTIHVAASGNGWIRPEDFIHPSRRTKLVLRLPKHRLEQAAQLAGKTLDVAGHPLRVGAHTIRPLSVITTLFARYVETVANDEEQFLADVLRQLGARGIRPKKMLCGIEHLIATPEGPIRTRSLMLANLTVDESLQLQQRGLGRHRHLGCGVFIPHKDIQELK
jgi:CRISPR-associated protein Cas6